MHPKEDSLSGMQGRQQGQQTEQQQQQQGSLQEAHGPEAAACSKQLSQNTQQLTTVLGKVISCEITEDRVRGVLLGKLTLTRKQPAIHLADRMARR